jgi:hypothetical protein
MKTQRILATETNRREPVANKARIVQYLNDYEFTLWEDLKRVEEIHKTNPEVITEHDFQLALTRWSTVHTLAEKFCKERIAKYKEITERIEANK